MATVLDQEVYTEPEAARLLGVAPSTLHYWLQGGERRGTTYLPIIRPEATDRRYVTWAEFIEAGWLRAYRRNRVPMRELRLFIELLRDELQVPYPLAHQRPLVSGKRLVLAAQQEAGLDEHWRLVDDQLMLTYPGQTFIEQVTWEGDLAAGWRPAPDPRSTVIVRPDVRFGRPSVQGISTLSIYEYAEEGASRAEIAADFGLRETDVRWALAYENARQAS
ncbi:MAG TPA: DUF433 domain-containing protein [Nocardioides sp.]|uniref:DUF433 domain-containing protein n=1 Tax=Nocardioides sp. TaxID=35761 RepID=UPI002BE7F507|nr:DUF433 domain-containing protein [Nocardioides sp.]HTW14954.1 DUF433 domain-containing protein [Nocardioides sp.]